MTEDAPAAARIAAAMAAFAVVRRRRRRRLVGSSTAVFFIAVFSLATYMGVFGGNVRVVQDGRVYRSAQLTGNGYAAMSAHLFGISLSSVLQNDRIGTVVNLRGGSLDNPEYKEEVETCGTLHVDHVDDAFSARKLPPPEALEKLFATFDHARYPIVIHCQAGSDRTGLACTIYAHLYEHKPLDEAESEELTWRYGHLCFGATHAMNDFFTLYRRTSHGKGLRAWIAEDYPALYVKSPERIMPSSAPANSFLNR